MSSSPEFLPRKGVVALLWSFAFLSYLLRLNITVAQQYMAREFSFSDVQIGYIFSAFLIGYSLFQLPGGVLGDRFGPRLVLGTCAVLWVATTALTGLLPGLLWPGAAAALSTLIAIRFLFGVAEAATYPVAMAAVSDWFPARKHAFINSLIFTGSTSGSAFAPPIVAQIMTAYGWRATFYLTAALPLVLAIFWFRQTKGLEGARQSVRNPDRASWWRTLKTRDILFLCMSYFCYCYAISIFVYWLFKYLVDVRHLSVINSGWVNSLPWIVATVTVPAIGYLATSYSDRVGFLNARRRIASACLIAGSVLLYAGAWSASIGIAVGAIAIGVGLLFSTESCYFSTAIAFGNRDPGAASGVMNLAGNLGGIAATTAVPLLVLHYGWLTALLSGSVLAVVAALTWYGLRRQAAV